MDFLDIFDVIKIPATIVHVFSVVLGMGAALTSDALFSFYSKDKKLNITELKTLSILSKIVLSGLVFIILSGLVLFLSDITGYLSSSKFITKMTIMSVLLGNGFVLHFYVWPSLLKKNFLVSKKESHVRKVSFVCGAISVVSWMSTLALGVLDTVPVSFVFLMLIYLGLVILGAIVSLIVEHRYFK